MPGGKLNDAHKNFILKQVSTCNVKITLIARMLDDAVLGKEYNFDPVSITHQAVSNHISKIGKTEIAGMQVEYLTDFNTSPFAHKLNRVKELERMYWQSQFDEPNSHVERNHRLQILRDIKAEIGDDVKMLTEAMAQSGTTVNVSVAVEEKVNSRMKNVMRRLRADDLTVDMETPIVGDKDATTHS